MHKFKIFLTAKILTVIIGKSEWLSGGIEKAIRRRHKLDNFSAHPIEEMENEQNEVTVAPSLRGLRASSSNGKGHPRTFYKVN